MGPRLNTHHKLVVYDVYVPLDLNRLKSTTQIKIILTFSSFHLKKLKWS